MQEPTRVGIIGVGKMGELHLRKYVNCPSARLAGFYDPNPSTASRVQTQYGTPRFENLNELLFECDAVIIASPTETHYSIARAALEAGVHILVEKPVSSTVAQANELVRLATARRLVFQVGFLERVRFMKLLEGMASSPVCFIESDRLSPSLGRDALDVVTDLMIHDLDLALSLIPEVPESVSAIGLPVLTPLVDLANARLEFASGAVVNLNASRVSDKAMRKFRIFSSNSYVSVDFIANTAEIFLRNGSGKIQKVVRTLPEWDALAEQASQFLHSVKTGQAPLVSGADGAQALKWTAEIISKMADRTLPGVTVRGTWAPANLPHESILMMDGQASS